MKTGLMIMASHQTFSGQIKHLTDQINFDQIYHTFMVKVRIEKQCRDKFQTLSEKKAHVQVT